MLLQAQEPLTSCTDNISTLTSEVTTFVTSLSTSLKSYTVSRCTWCVTPWVSRVPPPNCKQASSPKSLRELACAIREYHQKLLALLQEENPVLSEVNSTVTVLLNDWVTHKVNETKCYVTLTFKLTYYSS